MSTYYIGSAFSSTGTNDFTVIFYDTTGYTADSTGFTGLDWTVASGFMYVGDTKGMIGFGKTTTGTTADVYNDLSVGATGFKNGIYADTNGLYAVVDGTAIPYDSWGSDPLYTAGDFQDSVIDRLATPPAGSNGNRYLIIATASGDWIGKENYITEYQDAWVFITPSEGMMTWVEDEDAHYIYNGSSWIIYAFAIDDLSDVVISGTPANNEVLAYDTGGNWINQTATEAGLEPTITTLSIAKGGTNNTTFTSDYMVKYDGSKLANSSLTETNLEEYFGIGSGNTKRIMARYLYTTVDNLITLTGSGRFNYTNSAPSDPAGTILYFIIDTVPCNLGSLDLYLDDLKMNIIDAADGDELDRIYITGISDGVMSASLWSKTSLNEYTIGEYSAKTEDSFGVNVGGYDAILIRLDLISKIALGWEASFPYIDYYYT